jgi:hypothetical protein
MKETTKTDPCSFRCDPELRVLIETEAARHRLTKAKFIRIAVEEKLGIRSRQDLAVRQYETILFHLLLAGRCLFALLARVVGEEHLKESLATVRQEVSVEVRELLHGTGRTESFE